MAMRAALDLSARVPFCASDLGVDAISPPPRGEGWGDGVRCARGVGISGAAREAVGLDPGRLRPGVQGQGLWPCTLAPDNTAPCCPAWAAGDLTPPMELAPPSRLFEGDSEAGLRSREDGGFVFVSTAGMGLQNHPHASLVPVIPVNKTASQGAGGSPTALGWGVSPATQRGWWAGVGSSASGLH